MYGKDKAPSNTETKKNNNPLPNSKYHLSHDSPSEPANKNDISSINSKFDTAPIAVHTHAIMK